MIVTKNRRKEKTSSDWRINLLIVIPFLATLVIFVRLFDLQILKSSYYTALAQGQSKIFEDLMPERGEIFVKDKYSENFYPLATNHQLYLIYAVPKYIENPDDVALRLSSILEMEEDEILACLADKEDLYEPIKHELPEDKKLTIEAMNIEGVAFQPEDRRYYPENSLAAHIIGYVGFVDDERRGLYGVEGYYNERLGGKKGWLESERDALGRFISVGQKFIEEAEDGDDIVLTIDRTIQFKVEKYLKEGVEKFGAQKGTVIVMEPRTGEIVAMANYPNFNPNEYAKTEDVDVFSNGAIYSLHEPGSSFKPVVMAGALNQGLLGPGTTIEDNGSIKVNEYTIKNSDLKANGTITMTEVLEVSSNVGMVQVAQLMGEDALYNYINKFGFNDLTGIDLASEAPASIVDKEIWSESDLATASFGQGMISITPIQLVTAYAAIANGGMLVQPYIVSKFITPEGHEEFVSPNEIQQVLTPSTSATLSAMLVSVVENGFGGPAKIPGYKLAGKTGTAQVPNKGVPGYDPSQKITSFVGFGPIDDPRFVMLIKLDNPGGDVWGASTAAPIFKQIADELLKYYQIPPTESIED